MMVSTRGRYALRVMLDLAQSDGAAYVSLKAVAERQGVSLKYLESIVSQLHRGGLVESARGKDGGYRLARPAEAITVYEIIRLTEGTTAPVACISCDGDSCDRVDACAATQPMWQELDRMIEHYLSGITLRDLLAGVPTGSRA